jgi:hypothetical protein
MSLDPQCLHVGQTVTVRELNYGVQIDPAREGEMGLKVLAMDREHLVLEDAAGGTRSIPVYLIQKPTASRVESPEAA